MTQLMDPPTTHEPTERPPSLLTVPVMTEYLGPLGRRDSSLRRRIMPVLAIVVMVMAFLYATSSFTFAGAVECRRTGVAGATPAPGTPAGAVVGDAAKHCAETAGSRVATAAVTALFAAVVGVAGAVAPSRTEKEARRNEAAGDGDQASPDARPAVMAS